jgi:hypothetical protein
MPRGLFEYDLVLILEQLPALGRTECAPAHNPYVFSGVIVAGDVQATPSCC